MAKISGLITMLLLVSNANATCPSSIVGTYSGYEIHESWTAGKASNLSTSVFTVSFDRANNVLVQTSYHTSIDDPVGIQDDSPAPNRKYSFDAKKCSGMTWEVSDNPQAYYYFVVADSGKTIYATKQDVGDNETRITVFTKQ